MPQYFRMLDKSQVKSLFKLGYRYKLSDEEYLEKGRFVIAVLSWVGYETKCFYQDVLPFNNRFKPDWVKLYQYHLEHPTSVKTTWPLLPRVSEEETYTEYRKRMDLYLTSVPEPKSSITQTLE